VKRSCTVRERRGLLPQAHLDVRLGHHAVEERQVVAERIDRARVLDLRVRPEPEPEQALGHRGHVLVREAHVGAHEQRVARLDGRDPEPPGLGVRDRALGDDLLADRHRARRGRGHGRHDLAAQALLVVGEQPARHHDLAPDLVEAPRELLDRDLLAALEPLEQREVGRGQ
jgi:hypothetical protein